MRVVVEERKYARLLDAGDYWIIEDKVLERLPVLSRARTRTLCEIWFDLTELPNGEGAIIRAYFPKSIPKKVMIQQLERWNEKWERELEKAQQILEMLEQKGTEGGGSETPTETDSALRRLREYLSYAG